MQQPNHPLKKRRRWPRRLAIAAAVLLSLILVAGIFLGRYLRATVNAEDLEALLNETLLTATEGLYEASVGNIDWRSGGLSLRLEDLSLMLVPERLEAMDAAETTPEVLFQIQHATVSVTGVDLWSLLRRKGFRALSITLEEPLIQVSGIDQIIRGKDSPQVQDEAELAEVETLPAPKPAVAALTAPPKPPNLKVWRVAVENASLENYRRTEGTEILDTFTLFERFGSVSIELAGVDFADPDESRLLFADDLSIDILSYSYVWPDGLHEENHGRISLSTAGGYLNIEDLSLTPVFERRDKVASDGTAPTARKVVIDRIEVGGIDFAAIVDKLSFSAAEFSVAGASIDITGDDLVPGPEVAGAANATRAVTGVRPGAMATALLTGLPDIRVDRLSVTGLNFNAWTDRKDGRWLTEPERQHAVEDLDIELRGYASGKEIEFDPKRPFFADEASATAALIAVAPGKGRHQLRVTDWSLSDKRQHLSASSIAIVPRFDRRQIASQGIEPPTRLELITGEFSLTGLDYGALLGDVRLDLAEIRLESPSLSQTVSAGVKPVAAPDRTVRSYSEALNELLLPLPNIAIGSMKVTNANFEVLTDRTAAGWLPTPRRRLLISNATIDMDAWRHLQGGGFDPELPLLLQAADGRVGLIEAALGGGTDRLEIRGIELSSAPNGATIESLSLKPDLADGTGLSERIRSKGLVTRLQTGPIAVQGPLVVGFLKTGRLEIENLEIRDPRAELLELKTGATGPQGAKAGGNAATLSELVSGLPPIQVNRFAILDASVNRYVGDAGYDWSTLPTPLESIGTLDLELTGFDTSSSRSARRFLMSDRVELDVRDLDLQLGASTDTLRLGSLTMSSQSDSLVVSDARLSFGGANGESHFRVDRAELGNIPHGRIFRSLLDPPDSGAPVIAAMVDKNLTLQFDGVRGDLAGGKRHLEFGQILGSVADGSLSIDYVSMRPEPTDADPSTPETEFEKPELLLETGPVSIRGVDFEQLGRTGALAAASLEVENPVIGIVRNEKEPNASAPKAPTQLSDKTIAERIQLAVVDLPVISLDRLRIDDIAFHERRSLEGEPVRSIDAIDLAIDGLDLRPDRAPTSPEGVLYANDIRLAVPAQRTWIGKRGYQLEVGPLELSTGAGRIDLGSVHYLPPTTPEEYLSHPETVGKTRVDIGAREVSFGQIDLTRLLTDGSIRIGQGELVGLNVSILADALKTKPPRTKPRFSPHRLVQGLSILFAIDNIRLEDASVRYARRHRGQKPGAIWWNRLGGHLSNVSNDPARMSRESPLSLILHGWMLDDAPIELEWLVPLLEPPTTMSYSVRLGAMQAASLSSILLPMEGVRLNKGEFLALWSDVDIQNRHASGTFNSIYKGLEVQLENPDTGRRGLTNRALSAVINMLVPNNNYRPDGRPARSGRVDAPLPDDIGFFKVFWEGIKAGVIDLMG